MKKLTIILLAAFICFSCVKKEETPKPYFDGSYKIFVYSVNTAHVSVNNVSFDSNDLTIHDFQFDENEKVDVISNEVLTLKIYKKSTLMYSVTAYSYTFIAR